MDTLILTHWDMVDCLFDEVFLGKHEDRLHGPEMIEELFRYFASHDPRFNAAGFSWNLKGFYQYVDPQGTVYCAEGAIAAFLGLDTKTIAQSFMANQGSLRTIYRRFPDMLQARVWLRWHVQKMHGYDNKQRDLWTDYPRVFPQIIQQNNELSPEKD